MKQLAGGRDDIAEAVHLADRVIVPEKGRAKLDIAVPFPYPRRHRNVGLATIEGQLLAAILGD